MAEEKPITPRAQDYPSWYQDVVQAAELTDYAPVKGCMVIRPYGYAIWELIREVFDRRIKETGHQNAYFPLFIPESFMKKEAQHVEGFAPECAVVTHGGGKKLEEPLYVRPTSETIIYAMYAKWVSSWRDLPILINQWANVVRWEMRTRPFIRTLEFLWQEGHTAHENETEAEAEARKMLEVYREIAEGILAMPVLTGQKSESEKFAGALRTYAIEAMMQDGKALQAGTSHNLGQNFAKAFNLRFADRNGDLAYAWNTSWGVSTRLIGGLVMVHSDDQGLVLPPALAPIQAVIVPIYKSDAEKERVLAAARDLARTLGLQRTPRTDGWPVIIRGAAARVHLDDRDHLRPGAKFFEWERKGVPIRVELGPKDLDKGQVCVVRRDTLKKEFIPQGPFVERFAPLLEQIQDDLFGRAKALRTERTVTADTFADLGAALEAGRFSRSHWCGDAACEASFKEDLKATVRVIPFDAEVEEGACVKCGAKTRGKRAVIARAY